MRKGRVFIVLILLVAGLFVWRGTIAEFFGYQIESGEGVEVSWAERGEALLGYLLHPSQWFSDSESQDESDISQTSEADPEEGTGAGSGSGSDSVDVVCEKAIHHKELAMKALGEGRVKEYQVEMGKSQDAARNCVQE